MDAYRKGLDGKQAAWASKKYHGHWTLPNNILDELAKMAAWPTLKHDITMAWEQELLSLHQSFAYKHMPVVIHHFYSHKDIRISGYGRAKAAFNL